MKSILLAAAAALVLLAPGAAMAKDIPEGGLTLDEIVDWLKAGGLPAEIKTGDDGAKSITSSLDGATFHVYTYDCKDGRCGSLQFSEGFDTKGAWTAEPINLWNRENRWTRAYADKVNDPWIEEDVDLTPGGTYEILNDQLAIYRSALTKFRTYIKWDQSPAK